MKLIIIPISIIALGFTCAEPLKLVEPEITIEKSKEIVPIHEALPKSFSNAAIKIMAIESLEEKDATIFFADGVMFRVSSVVRPRKFFSVKVADDFF